MILRTIIFNKNDWREYTIIATTEQGTKVSFHDARSFYNPVKVFWCPEAKTFDAHQKLVEQFGKETVIDFDRGDACTSS